MGTIRGRHAATAGRRALNTGPAARRRGVEAERLAHDFLRQHGLKPIDLNFRTPRGEIDLVMQDGQVLVFVEVRSRTSNTFIHAAESIDARKRQRIILASQRYLQKYGDRVDCRFDVIIVTGSGTGRKIEWIKRAFDA